MHAGRQSDLLALVKVQISLCQLKLHPNCQISCSINLLEVNILKATVCDKTVFGRKEASVGCSLF